MVSKRLIRALFLLPALCLVSLPGCSKQSGAEEAVSESPKLRVVLLVFTDPRCEQCREDKPVIDSMRGKVDMIFLSWYNRPMILAYDVRSVPTYILLEDYGRGRRREAWRTHSATEARDKLGLSS